MEKNLKALENICVEDSVVYHLNAGNGEITFWMDLRFTVDHPLFQPGVPYSGRRGKLIFTNVTKMNWTRVRMYPTPDDVEPDMGEIDSIAFTNGIYTIEGSIGTVEFQSDPPVIEFEALKK